MLNSERFLVAFNLIEKQLKAIIRENHYISFYKAVEIASKTNPEVRSFREDLKEFSDLRNAIVHERTEPNFIIAEPHDTVVQKMEFIVKEISKPKKVIPLFQKEVTLFQAHDTLIDALTSIDQYQFSQFPVYSDNKFIGLITESGITRWLSHVRHKDVISFSEVTLQDIVTYEEVGNTYRFISRETNIYEMKEIFLQQIESEEPKLNALLITHHGKPNESLLGIITAWDIINVR
jgi:predicted transcriptional regulator